MADVVCACGCGVVLDPGGASLWFAGQGCQMKWQRTWADRPEEVLSRPEGYGAHVAALAAACSGVRAAYARVAGER